MSIKVIDCCPVYFDFWLRLKIPPPPNPPKEKKEEETYES